MADQVLEARVRALRYLIIMGGDLISVQVKPQIERPRIDLNVRSMDWTESDVGGACPSYERVLAAHAAWKLNPELIIIAAGGRSNVKNTEITATTAEVLHAELEALGVPENKIVKEGESFNSLEDLEKCDAFLGELGVRSFQIGILSMGWHLIRTKTTIDCWPENRKFLSCLSGPGVAHLSAERLLVGDDPERWIQYFKDLDQTPEMIRRRLGESLGVEQILTGYNSKYGPRPYNGFGDPLTMGE